MFVKTEHPRKEGFFLLSFFNLSVEHIDNCSTIQWRNIVERQFILEGLCCPLCAGKIEKGIQKLKGVKTAAVDFPARRLVMELSGGDVEGVVGKAAAVVQGIERTVVMVPEKGTTGSAAAEDAPVQWKRRFSWAALGVGAALFASGFIFDFSQWEPAVFAAAYLLIGGGVVLQALKNILRGRVFDENFLMTAASIGAFAIGEYSEGVAVMLFYQIGEAFQRLAVGRSRASISALMDIRPDFANLKTGDGGTRRVSPEAVRIGDRITVKPGEKIPLDGVVMSGRSLLDTSALTGESLPREAEPGSEVLSGSINTSGLLEIKVTREFGESTVSRILTLVQSAGARKPPVENFITKFARYYTPAVVGAALILAVLPPLLIPGAGFAEWIRRALVFLVVSCPCALVISVPLSFFGGIGGASRQGVLVKGGNYLEALNAADTVVFDKTGTLTRGVFTVSEIRCAAGWNSGDLLFYAAAAESNSNHPIALSIQKAYGEKTEQKIEQSRIASHEEIAGKGLRVRVDGRTVLAGNIRLMEAEGVRAGEDMPGPASGGTVVHVAVDGGYAGFLAVADEPKPDAKAAIAALRKAGVKRIAMLTGDNKAVAERIGGELGIDAVYAELLPHEKVEKLEILEQEESPGKKLVFVGDGINDAPALARSDIGIAMGGGGSDAAIEAADIVLKTDEPSKLAAAFRVAAGTHRIVWQNIIFALGVKAVILVLGALGIATMWAAVFGDVGVALIAVFNAMRAGFIVKGAKITG
jgi:Cd2+/Zn2+-exporting ATPase